MAAFVEIRITGRESRQVIPPQRMADPLPFPFNVTTLNMGLGGRRAYSWLLNWSRV